MAFSPEDLAQLGGFVKDLVGKEVSALEQKLVSSPASAPAEVPQTEEDAAAARAAQVGVPDVAPDAGPEYYVHLANGEVVTTHDSSSTHLPDADGKTQLVIGRYQVGG